MKRLLPRSFVALLYCLFLTSCETTADYGYFVEELNHESIVTLFTISDEAIRRQNFNTYSGLLSPGFTTVNKTGGDHQFVSRADYLDIVKELFATAEYIEVITMIMDIEYIEPGRRALVTIQEEERRRQYGNDQHFTSMSEVIVGFEDGWAYFERSTRIAQQVIDE